MEEYNMPKRLNGCVNTGEKIMDNPSEFTYNYENKENVNDKTFYNFNWTFNKQSGTATILLTADGHIDQSSTLMCNDFDRPLGLYNDESLYGVFGMMLDNKEIEHKQG